MFFLRKTRENAWIQIKGFWALKRQEETFGIATVKFGDIKRHLTEDLPSKEAKGIKDFFKHGVYLDSSYAHQKINGTHTEEEYKIWSWRAYCKQVWLADDFLKYGKLEHPISVFWSPDIDLDNDILNDLFQTEDFSIFKDIEKGNWRVSSGFGRNKLLRYFLKPEDDIKVAAFTTFGKKLKFDKIFNHSDEFEEYFGEGCRLHICGNWGTAIPILDSSIQRKVADICGEYHNKIYDWFKTIEITSNVKISDYNLKPPNTYHRRKIKGNVHFTLVSELLEKDEDGNYSEDYYFYMNKACILLPLIGPEREFYQDDKLTIKYTPM
jgi:hypothetical protein